ncbi:MAG: hypothetical protein JW741_09870 [Sedimentisphaerales bacterium]|nr:hypothetical protein [Sedimentisphaerales bacterium]
MNLSRRHRIGMVSDDVGRILLVDEQEVARDEQAELAIPDAGLIDDLRIYGRPVKP